MPAETKRSRIGQIGYALFAANALWRGCATLEDVLRKKPAAELKAGGQFAARWQQWISANRLSPQVFARVSSFTDLARIVHAGHAAAVLPEVAQVEFDMRRVKHRPVPALKPRMLVLIANARSIDRSGIDPRAAKNLAGILAV